MPPKLDDFQYQTIKSKISSVFPDMENFMVKLVQNTSDVSYFISFSKKVNGDTLRTNRNSTILKNAIMYAIDDMKENLKIYNGMKENNTYNRSFVIKQAGNKFIHAPRKTHYVAEFLEKELPEERSALDHFRETIEDLKDREDKENQAELFEKFRNGEIGYMEYFKGWTGGYVG